MYRFLFSRKFSMDIKIYNLYDHPEYIKTVAKRYRNVFFKDPMDNLHNTRYCIQHACQKNKIPQTLIVFYKDIPVGTAAIRNCDIAYRQDLSPRLANVFVLPKYRKMWIGTLLQKEVLKITKKLWYKKIYLYTKLEWYYEKTWRIFKELLPVNKKEFERLYVHKI